MLAFAARRRPRGAWRPRVVTVFRLSLTGLMHLYPSRFRRAYGAEMLELLEVRCAEEWARSGALAATLLWSRNIIDVFATALAERRSSSFELDGQGAPSRGHVAPSGSGRQRPVHYNTSNAGRSPDPSPPPPRRGDSFVIAILNDLRLAIRAFQLQPGFTAVVIVTLALGIGANTAIFSVVNGVLLRPLPYDDPDELVDVWGRFDPVSGFDFPTFPLSAPEWVDYRQQSRVMEDVAIFWASGMTITGGDGDAERVTAGVVSHNAFDLLRVQPTLGRMFSPEEDQTDAAVAVLEHGFWQSRLGGDSAIVGDTIVVNGVSRTVLGVMPEGFEFVPGARLWVPTGVDPDSPGNRRSHWIRSFGRLADGRTLEQAEAEMQTLMKAWEAEFPEIHTGHYLYLRSMMEDAVGSVRPALLLLLGASGFVLLIVCANVASVVLARGEDRVKEVAIRTAMGAGRAQIVRLLLTESMVLSLLGGIVGVLIAYFGVGILLDLNAGSIPRADGVEVDSFVLSFAGLMTLVTAMLFGLFPALHAAATDVQVNLKEGTRGASPSRSRLHFRRGLVVVQVALSFVLVLGAGLMIKSFGELLAVDPGYRTERRLVATLSLPSADYPEPGQVQAFYREILARVRSLPGVEQASAGSHIPLFSAPGVYDFDREGVPEPSPGEPAWNASFATVRTGFFETMEVRLQRGRLFQESDTADGMLVAVINEAMVEKFFAGGDPLGQRIKVSSSTEVEREPWMTIVGIVDDMRYQGLNTEARPAYYAPHEQSMISDYQSVWVHDGRDAYARRPPGGRPRLP